MQLAKLLGEQLKVPDGQWQAFLRFARGLRTGLASTGAESWTDVLGNSEDARLHPPHNLPVQTTPFIGRSREMADLKNLLFDSAVRLVNILGPGGMGKTRLALAAAKEQSSSPDGYQSYPQGIYFVSLAGVESSEFLPQFIAEAIDFQFSGADDLQEQLLRYLKTKNMLLVLDNFEHLLAGVPLLEALLRESPGLKLLVTSRVKLQLQSEQLFPIAGMRYPQEDEPLSSTEAGEYGAIELFQQCARRARPAFHLTGANHSSVVDICRLVEGSPLGIVLAAAWIDTLTLVEIAIEIGRDLDFLTTEMEDVPGRQRSLHAAFNHSWRLLSGRERDIYRRLSIFRGGFTAEAARTVAGASLHDLQGLVNKSLLTRASAGKGTSGRFEIHELLRQFAALELSKHIDVARTARENHSHFFLSLLQSYESSWYGSEQLETMASIMRDSDNIAAAWQHAFTNDNWKLLTGAIDSWAKYHYWRGLYAKGNSFCAELEKRLTIVMDPAAEDPYEVNMLWAKALAWQGKYRNRIEEGMAKLEESLAFLEQRDLDTPLFMRLKASILCFMAWRILPRAKERAHHLAEQALQLSLQLEDRGMAAECYSCLSLLDIDLAQLAEARENANVSLSIFSDLGDRHSQIRVMNNLAIITMSEGDPEAAEHLLRDAIDLCEQTGDRPQLAHSYDLLPAVLLFQGKLGEALHNAGIAVALCVEYGLREIEGMARYREALVRMHMGFYDRAKDGMQEGLNLAIETGNIDVQSWIWTVLGRVALVVAEEDREAEICFERALQLAEQIQDEFTVGINWGGLLYCACRAGAAGRAQRYAIDYLAYTLRIKDTIKLIEAIVAIAFYLAYFGSKERALELWHLASSHPYVANSQWYMDVAGSKIGALTGDLPPAVAEAAAGRGRRLDLWETAESLLSELASPNTS